MEKMLVTRDAEYIPSELSELLARCVCSDIGLFSVPDLFVRAGASPRCLMMVSGSFPGPSICIFESC